MRQCKHGEFKAHRGHGGKGIGWGIYKYKYTQNQGVEKAIHGGPFHLTTAQQHPITPFP